MWKLLLVCTWITDITTSLLILLINVLESKLLQIPVSWAMFHSSTNNPSCLSDLDMTFNFRLSATQMTSILAYTISRLWSVHLFSNCFFPLGKRIKICIWQIYSTQQCQPYNVWQYWTRGEGRVPDLFRGTKSYHRVLLKRKRLTSIYEWTHIWHPLPWSSNYRFIFKV